jgi:hypothetical protein
MMSQGNAHYAFNVKNSAQQATSKSAPQRMQCIVAVALLRRWTRGHP